MAKRRKAAPSESPKRDPLADAIVADYYIVRGAVWGIRHASARARKKDVAWFDAVKSALDDEASVALRDAHVRLAELEVAARASRITTIEPCSLCERWFAPTALECIRMGCGIVLAAGGLIGDLPPAGLRRYFARVTYPGDGDPDAAHWASLSARAFFEVEQVHERGAFKRTRRQREMDSKLAEWRLRQQDPEFAKQKLAEQARQIGVTDRTLRRYGNKVK